MKRIKTLNELGVFDAPWTIKPSETNETMSVGGVQREVLEIHCTTEERYSEWSKIAVVRLQAGGPETANANIIVASPDMYDALKELHDSVCMRCELRTKCKYYNHGESPCEIIEKAKTALAKAAGESVSTAKESEEAK